MYFVDISRFCLILISASCILLFSTCTKDHEELAFTNPFDPENPVTHGAPYNLRIKTENKGIRLIWDPISNVDGVAVYRSTLPNRGFERLVLVPSGEYLDTDAQWDLDYYYELRAYRDGIEAPPSPIMPRHSSMALIPAGVFSMGDHHNVGYSDEAPTHAVYLDAFYIDVHEVTNAQYAEFLNEYGKNIDAAGHTLLNTFFGDPLIKKVGGVYKPEAGHEKHPVIDVTWYGAAAYAQFYLKRLPTEAEWEKAARGGLVGKIYPWGNDITHEDANYYGIGEGNSWSKTAPVGSFAPNGYGLYDMAGNVWEWCADEYHENYYSISPNDNPTGPGVALSFREDDFTTVGKDTERVLRGGHFNETPDDLRVSNRHKRALDYSSSGIGFRCAY